MKDIVNQILKEEEVLRRQLEEAHARASELVARARAQAAAVVSTVAVELKVSAEKSRVAAEQGFNAEKEELLKRTRSEAVELREKRARDIPHLAQQIFDQITAIKI